MGETATKHTVFANADGTWVDGKQVSEFLEVGVVQDEVPEQKIPIVVFVGTITLLDTRSKIVVRVRYHGPYMSELSRQLKVISITDFGEGPDGSRTQLEIVRFDPKLFQLRLSQGTPEKGLGPVVEVE